ncbi:MAG: alpha/beta hydrolase [Muribaculaceae bacterium]|nr:alpha/beta hydrolase [Muribaculaceae bacterium]
MPTISTSSSEHPVAVLFVHGIAGNERIFDLIRPLVPMEWEQCCIILEGHGSDALAFSRASMEQWRQQVAQAVVGLRGRGRRVLIAAHSMGCLFALAHACCGEADGLFLLNPPLRVRVSPRFFLNSVRVAAGSGDARALAGKENYGVSIDLNPLHYYGWPRRFLELFAEIRLTRSLLASHTLDVPAEVFLGSSDELVSVRSAEPFASQPCCRVHLLPHSGHYYYPAADSDAIRSEFCTFVQKFSQ